MRESTYAILGMGRYGRKIVTTVAATGAEILIADEDSNVINEYANIVTRAVSLDMANPQALGRIGLENIDIAIVDMKNNLEASIMCTMVAKESGVKNVIATAGTDRFKETLIRVGADEVLIPEDEAAVRMARRLISVDFMEYFDIGGGLCVIKTSPKKEWTKRDLGHLKLPQTENVRIIAVEREDGTMDTDVHADTILDENALVAISIPKAQIYDLV